MSAASPIHHATLIVAIALFSGGCGGATTNGGAATTPVEEEEPPVAEAPRLACSFEGEPGERYARDCDAEIARYEERTGAIAERLAELERQSSTPLGAIRAGLATLVERRRQICADWNACATSREDHLTTYDWLSDELVALEAGLDAAIPGEGFDEGVDGLRAWAAGLAGRRPGAAPAPSPPTPAPAPAPSPPVVGSIPPAMSEEAHRRLAAAVRQQEQEIAELEELVELIERIRTAAEGASIASSPAICASGQASRARLGEMIRGANSSVGSFARSLEQGVADLCDRFARQATPDERAQAAIGRLFTHLDRVEGWMDDILRCHRPGADQSRCSNAYGPGRADDVEQARRVEGIVADLRRRLAGVREGRRPFPCDLDLPPELAREAWTMSVARAQMPTIERNVVNVCRVIGLDARGFEQSTDRLSQRLDQSESTAGSLIRVRRDAVERIRGHLGNAGR